MSTIKLTLKDGSIKEMPQGITVYDAAKEISGRLAKEAIVGSVNGTTVDLSYVLNEDVSLNIFTFDDEEGEHAFRHTSSHIMAQAIKRLYPDAKLAIGPAIENGFYYDIDTAHTFVPEDLDKIETEMRKIVKEDLKLERFELPRPEAIAFMKEKNEDYKVELIEDLPEDAAISFYRQGEFVDLCAGCHVTTTKKIKSFKLLNLAGAYWRGDEKNKMLQRIYGTSFPKASLLEAYILMLEEAKKRDHRKLGKELKLFALLEEGPGFPFMLPNGITVKNELLKYWRDVHVNAGYQEIETPLIMNLDLWKTSGHWDHYKENMYNLEMDETQFAVKPMNCPGAMLTFGTNMRSYRDLPLRFAEMGRVHRHELSGALHGLMRVRAFTQDDAHIFITKDQIHEEVVRTVKLIDEVYKTFGFSYHVELSTRPDDSMGSDEDWERAESALKEALDSLDLPFKLNAGDGAFYGPKIDFHLKDSIGRTWQCGTIQLDFQMPQRFDLTYIGKDGEKHHPIVIHRVAFGSIERFLGILIEEYAGKFPMWLAPVQVKILPISDRHLEYAEKVRENLMKKGIRVDVDSRAEKIGYKIREAQLEKAPYMLIIGDKELEETAVSVRSRDIGEVGSLALDIFIEQILSEVDSKQKSSCFSKSETI